MTINQPIVPFPSGHEVVDEVRLAQVNQLLAEVNLADFGDLVVTAFNRSGQLAPLLTICPPEHLPMREEDGQFDKFQLDKFMKSVLGLVAITLKAK